MNRGVTNLAEEVDCDANEVDDGLVGGRGKGGRAVDEVGAQQAGDGPVEEAVLEDVLNGHRVGRELVHEERLDLTLDEVKVDHGEGEPLRWGEVPGLGVLVE